MDEAAFARWLAARTWRQGVRYSRAVAWLLPLAALAVDLPHLLSDGPWPEGFAALLAWQCTAQAFFVFIVAVDRLCPRVRGQPVAVEAACVGALVLATWIGVVELLRTGDLSLHAAGSTFVAAVMCTARPVRRPLYGLGFLALAAVLAGRQPDSAALIAALVHPFCIAVLCLELDRFTFGRSRSLFAEQQRAEDERLRADRALAHVLPDAVAEELKATGRITARKHPDMVVLFADIAGFTAFSRGLPPDALLLVLHEIFSRFDTLAQRHGVEKIKTIGDAYMAAAPGAADAMCRLALDMQASIAGYNRDSGTRLALRIGIHRGPAVAGVLGHARYLYDVWGDTVNVASRLEAAAEPGRVLVSAAVAAGLPPAFVLAEREPVAVRDCGVLQTWWLESVELQEALAA